jgi:dTDP-4-dehydrorhamnose 3,5-epimerase-like enzyme
VSGSETRVAGVRLHRSPERRDARGSLVVTEGADDLPFAPARYFVIHDVPPGAVRGAHAHRECHQLFVCVAGSCVATVDDGAAREQITLDSPALGLHAPPGIWVELRRFSPGARLLVLASHPYDPDDYVRDYEAFRRGA